jgi:hypothetical protein
VKKIHINVVGSVSEIDEVLDIETVAKVFVVARRMKDLTNTLESKNIITKPPKFLDKKDKKHSSYSKTQLAVLTIKGFN